MQLWVRKELTMAVRTVMTNCTMVFHFLRFLNIVISFSEVIKSHADIRKLLKVTQISLIPQK